MLPKLIVSDSLNKYKKMTSPINCAFDIDKYLDDAALWLSSTTAASISAYSPNKPRKSLPLKDSSPVQFPNPSPLTKFSKNPRTHHNYSDGQVLQEPSVQHKHRPRKIARYNTRCESELSETSPPPLAMVKHVQRMPTTPPVYSSPNTRNFEITGFSSNNSSPGGSDFSPATTTANHDERERECDDA